MLRVIRVERKARCSEREAIPPPIGLQLSNVREFFILRNSVFTLEGILGISEAQRN